MNKSTRNIVRTSLLLAIPLMSAPAAAQTGLLSVKDFGAVGNGTTDDRAAIQRAIDHCQATTKVGRFDRRNRGSLYVPPGTYRICGALRITNGCEQHLPAP